MKEKIIYLYIAFIFVFFVIILNLYEIQTNNDYLVAAENQQTKEIILQESRGMIYDCNLEPLVNFKSEETYTFFDKSFKVDFVKRYDDENTASQLIGYIDKDYNGVTGIEKAFDDVLKKHSGNLTLKYKTTARNDVLLNREIEVKENNYLSKGGVMLTIDKSIQRMADNALEQNTQSGAVVIMEIKSGALRAVSSYPKINQSIPSNSLINYKEPFVNRAFSSYNVGSIFKLVTSICVLEENKDIKNYNCKGYEKIGDITFSCFNNTAHGNIDMRKALEKSCNCYFINLSKNLNKDKMMYYAKKLGFGTKSYYADGLYSKSGTLPKIENLSSKEEMAALSFGQSKLMATPIQIAELTATIADDGIRHKSYLIEGLVDEMGDMYNENNDQTKLRAISKETANILMDYMESVGEEGTGKGGMPVGIYGGAKTATAETGIIKNGKPILQTWYTGFINGADNKPKYAITVLVEGGKSGSKSAAPVFYNIASRLRSMGYLS